MLVPTTDRSLIEPLQRENYNVWGSGMSVDEYISREWDNYGLEYMRFNQMKKGEIGDVYFVWKNDETGVIEGGCEFFVREAWLKTENGVEIIKCGTLGSVYVFDEFRGTGVSKKMLDACTEITWDYLPGEKDISMLWSEVGDKFYERWGYKALADETNISQDGDGGDDDIDYGEAFTTRDDEKIQLIAEDFKKKRFAEMNQWPINTVVIIPSFGLFKWFARRVEAVNGGVESNFGRYNGDNWRVDIKDINIASEPVIEEPITSSIPMAKRHDGVGVKWERRGKWCWF